MCVNTRHNVLAHFSLCTRVCVCVCVCNAEKYSLACIVFKLYINRFSNYHWCEIGYMKTDKANSTIKH